MSKSDKSRRPRYTGYGRPVYHDHGSRRQMIEQQDTRSAIREQDDEPLAEWERELLYGSPRSEATESTMMALVNDDTRAIPPIPRVGSYSNPFNIGIAP
jgi:hypothetical protein